MAKGRPGIKILCINDGNCYSSIASASKHYKVASSSICKQMKGERTTAGGYHFVKITSNLSEDDLKKLREKALEQYYNIKPI